MRWIDTFHKYLNGWYGGQLYLVFLFLHSRCNGHMEIMFHNIKLLCDLNEN